jgi:predicted flap endonuclease-1-like 5' DNA nuclease
MNIGQFFSNFGSAESIMIMIWLIIAFLLGFLVEYFLVQGVQRRLQNELEETEKEAAHSERELHKAQEELTLQEADLKKAAFELDEARNATTRVEEEKNRWMLQANAVNAEVEKNRADIQTYQATVEDLNNQILGLKTRNTQLAEQIQTGTTSSDSAAPMDTTSRSIYDNQAVDRLTSIESKLEQLTQENLALMQELQRRPVTVPATDIAAADILPQLIAPEILPEPVAVVEHPHLDMENSNLLQPDRNALRQVEKDDLTAIEGVGPFLEKKLNEINVFTYEQIAHWDAATITQVTHDIQFFEGRIEKDDWIGQAQRLLEFKNTGIYPPTVKEQSVAPAYVESTEPLISADVASQPQPILPVVEIPTPPTPPVGPTFDEDDISSQLPGDDLALIEGVGPKIALILKKAGIHFFADLAKAEPEMLRNLLHEAGPIFKIQDPASWPSQARLAMNGEWEVLKDYQTQLRGGK